MKSAIKQLKEYVLVLSEDEARILRGMVQNPMCDPEEEPQEISDLRESIFKALKS
jgi:hypothetical protein